MECANLTEPIARAEVARYAAWPTQASSYLVGCLAILDIRSRYLARTGSAAAALRDFHDRLAGSRAFPRPWRSARWRPTGSRRVGRTPVYTGVRRCG